MQAVRTVGRVVREGSGPERAAQVALLQSRGAAMAPVALAAATAVGSRPGASSDPFFDIATPVPPSVVPGGPDSGSSWGTWIGSLLARVGSALPSGQVVAGAAVVAAVGGVVGYLVARTLERADAERLPKSAGAIVFRTHGASAAAARAGRPAFRARSVTSTDPTLCFRRCAGNQALAVSSEPDAPSGSVSPAHLHVGVCTVCFDAPCNTIFAPCGHMCTCASCADQLSNTCPLCRSEVHDRIVIREVKA